MHTPALISLIIYIISIYLCFQSNLHIMHVGALALRERTNPEGKKQVMEVVGALKSVEAQVESMFVTISMTAIVIYFSASDPNFGVLYPVSLCLSFTSMALGLQMDMCEKYCQALPEGGLPTAAMADEADAMVRMALEAL